MEEVSRFDIAKLGRVRRTQQGFIQVPAKLTRTGVLEYRRPDGSMRRELRLPSEVFAARSLSTLGGAPVTDGHKGGMVTPDNVRDLSVGMVNSDVRHDEKFVESTLTIQDKDAIKSVLDGKRKEVSAGYRCGLEWTEGEYNGQHYDCIQRGIKYNHVAILPENAGRAGGDVSIHLDSNDALSTETFSAAHFDAGQLGLFIQQQLELLGLSEIQFARDTGIDELKLTGIVQGFDSPSRAELQQMARRLNISPEELDKLIPDAERRTDAGDIRMNKITLHLDGANFDVEVPEALADDLARRFKARDEKLTTETNRADAAEAKRDELQGKFDAADEELTKVKSPEHIQERIASRVDLEGRAKKVLGDDAKFDGKSDSEIMAEAIEKAGDEVKLDGKDDNYVRGVFEYVTDHHDAKPAKPPTRNTRGAARGNAKPTGDDDETKLDAREEFIKRSQDAWKQPLGVSKDKSAN